MTQHIGRRSTGAGSLLAAAALLLLAGGRAEAQFGLGYGYGNGVFAPYQGLMYYGVPNGGYWGAGGLFDPYQGLGYYGVPNGGFGYWPGYWGGPGYGQLWPQRRAAQMANASRYASRYNLNSAELATGYQAGNIYRQMAYSSLLNNGGPGAPRTVRIRRSGTDAGSGDSPGVTARARPEGAAPRAAANRRAPSERPATFREMIADDGEVFWPLGAPDNGELGAKRKAAGRAIQQVMQDAKDRGEPSVRKVIAARQALADYAEPAAEQLKEDSPDDVKGFATFIQTLDGGLRSLVAGNAPAGGAGGRADIEPPSAPKTAGDVLKKGLDKTPRTRKP